jgi:hypothetical protein
MPEDALDPLAGIDTRSADAVVEVFREAASANLNAACRQGCCDVVPDAGTLIATGDLHDNPINFARVLKVARLHDSTDDAPRRVILHEVIHSERLMGGVDMSHRALLRVAALKLRHPETVHPLLANHELSQIVGAGIIKDGVRVVDAFNDGVAMGFADRAEEVEEAIAEFIRSMPLALITGKGTNHAVLCAHSLPPANMMDRFDPSILDRELTEADYEPRQGSAHIFVWGRAHSPEHLSMLADTWGISLFVVGHQKAETGVATMPPNAVILNSDHERGVILPIDLAEPPSIQDAAWSVTPLAGITI